MNRDSIKPKVFEEREMGVRWKGEGNFLQKFPSPFHRFSSP